MFHVKQSGSGPEEPVPKPGLAEELDVVRGGIAPAV